MPDLPPVSSPSAHTSPAAAGAPAPRSGASMVRRLGPTGPLALLATFGPPLGTAALVWKATAISAFLKAQGPAGVILYTGAFALLAGLALLPTYAQAILGGYVFGLGLGIPAALTGFLGGALIGYLIADRASGGRVMALMDEHPRWRLVRDALVGVDRQGHGLWRTMAIVALIRLPPNSPFAITNLVMASVKVPLLPFLFGTVVGLSPRTIAAVYLGSTLKTLTGESLRSAGGRWVLIAGVVTTIIVILVIGRLAQRALTRFASRPGEPVKASS
jgi:uncharacterized membrane protein YdjX (TVP38/TMEM64 family)